MTRPFMKDPPELKDTLRDLRELYLRRCKRLLARKDVATKDRMILHELVTHLANARGKIALPVHMLGRLVMLEKAAMLPVFVAPVFADEIHDRRGL